jgi:hypothetical protein
VHASIKLHPGRKFLAFIIATLAIFAVLMARTSTASAATGACTAPSTDYGSATGLSVTVPAGATISTVWSRVAIPDTTNNNYLLEIDNSSDVAQFCYTVTASAGAVYTAAEATAGTYFNNDTTNWVSTAVSLPAGTYHLKFIGNAPNVLVDEVLLSQAGDGCTAPTGTGTNCKAPTDTQNPTGNIVPASLPAGTAVANPTIQVAATDNVGVTGVDIYDGATKLGSATLSSGSNTNGTWSYAWNTSALTVGSSHTITARLIEATTAYTTTASVTVTIKDGAAPTTATVTAPTAGATLSGTATLTATAKDNVAPTSFTFAITGPTNTSVGPITSSGCTPNATCTVSTSLNTTTLTNGSYSVSVTAKDAAGNTSAASATVAFTVNNGGGGGDTTPPTGSVTAPTANAVLSFDLPPTNPHLNSAAYPISATASDNVGVTQVVFKVDGVTTNITGATVTTPPYNATLDLTKLSCGTHIVTATASDAAGNSAVVGTISFTATYAEDAQATPDCHVTFLDLSVLAANFNKSGAAIANPRADMNLDSTVNFLDLSMLAANFNKH